MALPNNKSQLIAGPTNFDDVQLPGPGRRTAQANGQQKPKSRFWLNVGVQRTLPDGSTKLVSLPRGIALDELEPNPIPKSTTKNPEFRNLRIAEAQLWEKIQKLMSEMKPGENRALNLQVEIRFTDEPEQVEEQTETENPFLVNDIAL